MKRLEQDRRIDVALVIRTEHDGGRRKLLSACDAEPDARACQRQAHPRMPERIHASLPAEENRDDEPGGPRHEDVGEDDEVGQDGAEGDEEGQRLKCTKKRPGDKLPGV